MTPEADLTGFFNKIFWSFGNCSSVADDNISEFLGILSNAYFAHISFISFLIWFFSGFSILDKSSHKFLYTHVKNPRLISACTMQIDAT